MQTTEAILPLTEVVRALEFSGFGPTHIISETELLVRTRSLPSKDGTERWLDFHITVNPDGSIGGFPSQRYNHQNPLPPVIKAALIIIEKLYVMMAGFAPLADNLEWQISPRIKLLTTYLWLTDIDNNKVITLNEILIDGVAVWQRVGSNAYDSFEYTNYYVDIAALVDDYRQHGELPQGISYQQMTRVYQQCFR